MSDPGASAGWIVQFRSPSVSAARRAGIDVATTRADYDRFRLEAPGVEARLRAEGVASPEITLGRRLEISLNAVAIRAPAAALPKLRELPYVAEVFPDDTVRADLDQSLHQIGVDSLRAALGVSGDGVVVSIVDTGIDYTHPALGGCFGPGCRVIGGYDFYFGDNDPFDDHGHGTHVAGIVGGDAPGLEGVAPGVHFLAYKVLGPAGLGLTSDVVAGIDRSLDPNSDLDLEDAADVINLSLGATGNANDAASQAVDAAVEAGTICVVAAGNSSGYFRINSPACARRSIAVGAVDATDALASFSSKGPSLPDYDLKPDLVAPGVDIVSAYPGGGSRSFSGTSMAAPHVAGVVALLLENDPSWSPDRVKSALMGTCEDLGLDPFRQGAGRVDAFAAAAADIETQPASVSFGLAPPSAQVWGAERTLRLRNRSGQTRMLNLSVASDLPPGSSCIVIPASLTLAAGDSADVAVQLDLDHAPFPSARPYAYSGRITISGGSRDIGIPFGVLRAGKLVVNIEGVSSTFVYVHDRASFSTSLVASASGPAALLVAPGTYDVLGLPGFDVVAYEGIVVSDSQSVVVRRSDAIHTVEFVGITEQNQPASLDAVHVVVRYAATGAGVRISVTGPVTFHASTISPAYRWEWLGQTATQVSPFYLFRQQLEGVSGPVTVQNAPGELRHVLTRYHPEAGATEVFPLHFISDGPLGIAVGSGRVLTSQAQWSSYPPNLLPDFGQDVYFLPSPDPGFLNHAAYVEAYLGDPFDEDFPDAKSPFILEDSADPIGGYAAWDQSTPVCSIPDGRLDVGIGPLCWFGRLENQPGALNLKTAIGQATWLFVAQQGSWRDHGTLPYELRRQGQLVQSGTLAPKMGDYSAIIDSFLVAVTPGAHTLTVVDSTYVMLGIHARSTATLDFDTSLPDPNPPTLIELGQFCGTERCEANWYQGPTIRFRAVDDQALQSVTLSVRALGASSWLPVPLSLVDGAYVGTPPLFALGPASLRIVAVDASGNSMTYTAEPAFGILGFTGVLAASTAARVEEGVVRLEWTLPEPLGSPAAVERSEDGALWTLLAERRPELGTRVTFDDPTVTAGRRYAYRLRVTRARGEDLTEPYWVDTGPVFSLGLLPIAPNPGSTGPVIRFTLPSGSPAQIEVLDVAGRRMLAREVGRLGAGEHVLDLKPARRWEPGLYFVRLRGDGRTLTRRYLVVP